MTSLIVVLEQIENILQSILDYYHETFGVSWGWAIILLTVTVRIAILPLTIKQFRSMAAMQRIQPKVKALQGRYKGRSDRESKQQLQKEMMELYREHNVNPFASCLPLLFQIPIFFGLFQTLNNFDEPGDLSFYFIPDITEKLSEIGGATELFMVLAYSLSMLGSVLLFSFIQDRTQKLLFASMSVIFIPFILSVPAGVGLYWITTNLWTIAQQGIVKKTMGHHFPSVKKPEPTGQKRSSRNPPKVEPVAAKQPQATTRKPKPGRQQRKRKRR